MDTVVESHREFNSISQRRRPEKMCCVIRRSTGSETSDETLSPSPVSDCYSKYYENSSVKAESPSISASSSVSRIVGSRLGRTRGAHTGASSTGTELNVNFNLMLESPGADSNDVARSGLRRGIRTTGSCSRGSYCSIPESPFPSVHILEKDGTTRRGEEDEIPMIDIQKDIARFYDLRKASLNGQRSISRLDQKKSYHFNNELGSLKLNLVNKHRPAFDDLVYLQQLEAHEGPIWCLEFSRNGQYFASGGSDHVLRVWRVTSMSDAAPGDNLENKCSPDSAFSKTYLKSTPHEGQSFCQSSPLSSARDVSEFSWVKRNFHSVQSMKDSTCSTHIQEQLFHPRPFAELVGHTADITCLSWTSDGKLLSGSLDGTVRHWNIDSDMGSYLEHVFCMGQSVLCLDSHPKATSFVCGLSDGRVCVWDTCLDSPSSTHKMSSAVTAISFTEDGSTLMLGVGNGIVQIRESENMKLKQSVDIKSKVCESSAYVTGFSFRQNSRDFVVGSRNNKCKIFEASDFKSPVKPALCEATKISRVSKLKGATISKLIIKPSFSEDGRHIICGSEDGKVYIWDSESDPCEPGYESWVVENDCNVTQHSTVVTTATFVPKKSVQRCLDYTSEPKKVAVIPGQQSEENLSSSSYPPRPELTRSKSLHRSSALLSNIPKMLDVERSSTSFDGDPEATVQLDRTCSGLQRAKELGRVLEGGQNLRRIGAQGLTMNSCSFSAQSRPLDGDDRAGIANPRRKLLERQHSTSLYLEHNARTSASMLISYKKVLRSGSEIPENAMVIATDALGHIHVYARTAVAEELKSAKSMAEPRTERSSSLRRGSYSGIH